MEKNVKIIIDRIFNTIDNINPSLDLKPRIEMALMVVIEVRAEIQAVVNNEINPKWKVWEDARLELRDMLRTFR